MMQGYEYLAVALLPLGILLGLIFGPAKERLDNAYTDGFIAGLKANADPQEIKRLRHALEKIDTFGRANPGRGFTCARKARAALEGRSDDVVE